MKLAGYRVRIVPRSRVYHLGGGTLQTDSPAKVFYNHRNNLAMHYKCASPAQRLCVAVARPALDLLAALSYLMQGRRDNFRAVFRAWRGAAAVCGCGAVYFVGACPGFAPGSGH